MTYDARDDTSKERMLRVWAQAIASPVQRITAGAGIASLGFMQQLANWRTAASENEQLKGRVEQMEAQLREASVARQENNRLKELLALKDNIQYQVVTANVIARDPSEWFRTIMIDRGRLSGVETNMPVITPSGIVGRVVATSPWTAQVMLITDEKAAAGAIVGQLGESDALGSIRGLGDSGLMEMRYVSGLEEVNVGDTIMTTGQDGIYPAGLSVGDVVKVKPGSATVPHVIHVKPSARLDALYEVAVLLYRAPQRVHPDQALPNVDRLRD